MPQDQDQAAPQPYTVELHRYDHRHTPPKLQPVEALVARDADAAADAVRGLHAEHNPGAPFPIACYAARIRHACERQEFAEPETPAPWNSPAPAWSVPRYEYRFSVRPVVAVPPVDAGAPSCAGCGHGYGLTYDDRTGEHACGPCILASA